MNATNMLQSVIGENALLLTTNPTLAFRKDNIISSTEVFNSLLITVIFVATFSIIAWVLYKKGWLNRWTGVVANADSNVHQLKVVEARQISRRTTIYRIRDGKSEYLLVESLSQIKLSKSDAVGTVHAE